MLSIPRIMIAGTHSGVGKTTIVTGILAILKNLGYSVQSYKIGPDYIDPGYHQLASGKPSHNLDSWLIPQEKIPPYFIRTAKKSQISIIEGVMGLYDGGRNGVSSSASIAKLLQVPVILVIDAKSMGESAAAIALGFKSYDSDVNLVGVIINRLGSKNHELMIREGMKKIGIPILGCVYRDTVLTTPERHLGLTPTTEHDATILIKNLTEKLLSQINIDLLIQIAEQSPKLPEITGEFTPSSMTHLRIGVAMDEVFSFYYTESLDVFRKLGAEIIPFSPLHDKELPENIHGLISGGGFPEMFLEQLSANIPMHTSIKSTAAKGLPIYAECGGLMYLCREISSFSGASYPMVNLVPAVCEMQNKLQTVGYVEALSLEDNVLIKNGEKLRGHEFHFSLMKPDKKNTFPWAFQFTKMRTGQQYAGGYVKENILASYLHMHFMGNEKAAASFVNRCLSYKESQCLEAHSL